MSFILIEVFTQSTIRLHCLSRLFRSSLKIIVEIYQFITISNNNSSRVASSPETARTLINTVVNLQEMLKPRTARTQTVFHSKSKSEKSWKHRDINSKSKCWKDSFRIQNKEEDQEEEHYLIQNHKHNVHYPRKGSLGRLSRLKIIISSNWFEG